MDDWRLLREYHEKRSEAAFGRLVEQHIKMVYWTCRRDLSNPELAEDAAQVVFILLARKAAAFKQGVSISGWLFNASRYVARDFNKREARRVRREEAAIMQQPASHRDSEWHEVEPWLNDGLSSLPAADREAILQRYFNDLSTQELAGVLGTTEANARKKLSRAIDRLRRHLAKEGAVITSAVLSALLTQHSARAVPVSLCAKTLAAVHQAALGQASALQTAHAHCLLAKKGLFILMEATTKKTIVAVIAVIVLSSIVALPVAGWKIYHARALAAQIGQGGFTDLTASEAGSTAASGPATASARSQITVDYQKLVDSFNRHDLGFWATVIEPNAIIENSEGKQVQTGAGVAADNQRQFTTHPDMKVKVTLQSLDVQGDQAITHSEDRTTMGPDPGAGPAGRSLMIDEKDEIHWQNQGGKWVIVRIQNLGQTTQTL